VLPLATAIIDEPILLRGSADAGKRTGLPVVTTRYSSSPYVKVNYITGINQNIITIL
jgi:hypothetical protein